MTKTEKYLHDIINAIGTIESYQVFSFDEFAEDTKTQDAIMYNLIIMGEAANQLPREFQNQHPEIPWSAIIGTRHVIVHGYDQVKSQIVWDIVQKDLIPLKENIQKII